MGIEERSMKARGQREELICMIDKKNHKRTGRENERENSEPAVVPLYIWVVEPVPTWTSATVKEAPR